MLEKNLLALEKNYPELYVNMISSEYPVEENINITPVEINGHYNCKIKTDDADIFLHSAYAPYNEASKWLDKLSNEINMYVVIGGGFYYHIDYLISQYPNKKILIIEPSYSIFYHALKEIDLTKYLENKNILILVSQNSAELSLALAKILINKGIEKFDFSCLASYRQLYKAFCVQMESDAFNMVKTLRANIGTEYVHSRKWVFNAFKNLRKTNIDTMPLESIFNAYKGIPALIVSAGPSLAKHLELLKNNQDKFFIIAAGSAVNVLERNSIIPHMVVAVDAEEIQDNIFRNIMDKNITLAYGHSFRYTSLDLFPGKKYWFRGNADSIVDFFEEHVGMKTDCIEIGPSCANEAMDIVRRLGCNPLIFIGQDLAYTNQELYSKGVVHDTSIASDIGDRIVTKDMYGRDITTKTAFLVMKAYFENYVRNHNEVKYINCTEGGLEIIGMDHQPFSEVVNKLTKLEVDIFKDIEAKYCKTKNDIHREGYEEKNHHFFEFVEAEVKEVAKKSKSRIEKANKLLQELPEITMEEAQKAMDEIIRITDEIEETRLHKGVFHSICAAYFLAIRQTSYTKLEEVHDPKEKYVLLLDGILKQYLYYEVILQSLKSTITIAD